VLARQVASRTENNKPPASVLMACTHSHTCLPAGWAAVRPVSEVEPSWLVPPAPLSPVTSSSPTSTFFRVASSWKERSLRGGSRKLCYCACGAWRPQRRIRKGSAARHGGPCAAPPAPHLLPAERSTATSSASTMAELAPPAAKQEPC
jgi:hypothetical protein